MKLYAFGILLFASSIVIAAPTQLTYQGRILNADGTPLTYNNVSFIFQIRADVNDQCLLYQEQVNGINLSLTGGVFDTPIGFGTPVYPTGGSTILDAFDNSATPLDCGTCVTAGTTVTCSPSGTQYTPGPTDTRTLQVLFHDGTAWKTITPSSTIRSVPFAGHSLSSQKLGSYTAADFVLKNDVNNPGGGSVSCNAGNFITWNATTKKFGCAGVAGASGGTVTSVSASAGSNPYLTVTADPSSPVITLNVGTVAGTVAAGNDSRLVNALQPGATAGGDLSGTYPNPSVAKIQNIAVSATAPSGAGQVLRYNGTTQYLPTFLNLSDIHSSVTPASTAFPATSCTANQTLTWISLNDTLACTAIAIDDSQIAFTTSRAANTVLAAPSGGAGAPTFRTLTAADLPIVGATGVYANGGNSFGAAATLGTNDNNSLTFKTNNTNQVTIATDGKVGVGTASPTAILHLKAGTAAANTAPLKLTSGVNLSTIEAGAIEYDGTNLYFTDSTPARRTIATTSATTYSGVSSISNSGGNITLAPNATTGSVLVTSTTPSTGAANGALIVSGGAGFAGDIYSAASINAATTMSALTSILTPQLYGSASASGNIKIDGTSHATKGSVLLASAGGKVGVGVSAFDAKTGILEIAGTSASDSFVYVNPVMTNTATDSSVINAYNSFVPSSAPGSFVNSNGISSTVTTGSANANANTSITGMTSGAYYFNASGTIGNLVGGGLSATNQGNGIVNAARGASSLVANLSGGTIGAAYGVDANITNSGTITTANGLSSNIANGTGTITNAYGLSTIMTNGTGTITNAFALRANPISNAGTITNNYGLYIGKQNGAGITTSYGIYQADVGDKSYFAGNVGVGTVSPGSALDVKGTLRLSGATSGYVGFAPAAVAGATTYTLPTADGTNGYALMTNGSGTLNWALPAPLNSVATYQVRVATTANITLSGTQTVDSVALAVGDRVLVKNQTADTDNGIYVVAAGAWTRATDFDTWTKTLGHRTQVSEGNRWTGMTFGSATVPGGTLGTDSITWNSVGSASDLSENVAMGLNALNTVTTGSSNTAIGYFSLAVLTNGAFNTGVGSNSLTKNTSGTYNTAVGYGALKDNTNGQNNSALGVGALSSNVSKFGSTAVGHFSMYYADSYATPGVTTYNTAIGAYSLRGSTTASANTGIKNTAVGYSALTNMTSGSNNIGIGWGSGSSITTSSNNVILGSYNGSGYAATTNNVSISDGAGNEYARFISSGNLGIGVANPATKLQVAGIITPSNDGLTDLGTGSFRFKDIYSTGVIQTSDGRLKKNIQESDLGLDFVNRLRPVSYKWKQGDDHKIHYGLIAQETEKVIADLKQASGRTTEVDNVIVAHDEKTDRYGVRYTELISPVIKAVQELYASLLGVQGDVATLKAKDAVKDREIASVKAESAAKDKKIRELEQRLERIEKALRK